MDFLPSFPAPEVERFECNICYEDFEESDGIAPCEQHFYCNQCAVQVFRRSLRNMNEFPVVCCSRSRYGVPLHIFKDIVDAESLDAYDFKLEEHTTPKTMRLYCANPACAKFLRAQQSTRKVCSVQIATCTCGTITCTSCRELWKPGHICQVVDPTVRPAWLPEYNELCRAKQCPKCREWIELSEACNHMACTECAHQFCFVCLVEWVVQHEQDGCPMYGDPKEGYDNELYERTARGLHLYTGRDREGYDRRGADIDGKQRDGTVAPPESDEWDSPGQFVDADDVYPENFDEDARENEYEGEFDAQVEENGGESYGEDDENLDPEEVVVDYNMVMDYLHQVLDAILNAAP